LRSEILRLANGNVASRILPIRIHDLDSSDQSLIEKETGGPLRAIDFVYREPGVNRPLKPNDSRELNQNKTDYRNQINKVANAMKDMLGSMNKTTTAVEAQVGNQPSASNQSNIISKKLIFATIIGVMLATTYFIYHRIIAGKKTSPDKSIAILPFADMSPNHELEFFGDGVADEIINVLSETKGFTKVIARTSSFKFKGRNDNIQTIGKELGVATLLEGSVKKSENTIRIHAKLVDVASGESLWQEVFEHKPGNLLVVYDTIARAVAEALRITLEVKTKSYQERPWNVEALNYYQQGRHYQSRAVFLSGGDNARNAIKYFEKAWQADSSRAIIQYYLAYSYFTIPGDSATERSAYHLAKSLKIDPLLPEARAMRSMNNFLNYRFEEALLEIKEVVDSHPDNPAVLIAAGNLYRFIGKFDKAIGYFQKAVEINPMEGLPHQGLGVCYFYMGQYDNAVFHLSHTKELTGEQPLWLPMALLLNGQADDAIAANQHEKIDAFRARNAILFDTYSQKYHQADSALTRYIETYGKQGNYDLGATYAYLGRKDLAFRYLNMALKEKESSLATHFMGNPLLDPIRTDARFFDLKKQLNLPEW
jgi:TolB-like protein/Tfp pilus assembly protein PilF